MAKQAKEKIEIPQNQSELDPTENVEDEKKKGGIFQWILFVVIIPLMFAVMVVLVILFVADVNVFDTMNKYASKIPFISSLVDDSDSAEKEIQEIGEKVVELEANNTEYVTQIDALTKDVEDKNQLIEQLNKEITDLKQQLQQKQDAMQAAEVDYSEIVKSFESMSPKKAAELIEYWDEKDAIVLLSRMKNDAMTAILEKMTPETAANLALAIPKIKN